MKLIKNTVLISIPLFMIFTSLILMKGTTFSKDYRVFFDEGNLELEKYEQIKADYTNTDNIELVIKPVSGTIYEPETIKAIVFATEKAWELPFSIRVDSVTNFQHVQAKGDDLVVESLWPYEVYSQDNIATFKQFAESEPQLFGRLVSPKGNATSISVSFEIPLTEKNGVSDVNTAINALVSEIEAAYPNIELGVVGLIKLNNTYAEATKSDLGSIIPMMILAMVLFLALLTRSITGVLVTLLIAITSVMTALGVSAFLGWPLTTVSIISPVIILTVTIASAIHFITTFYDRFNDKHYKQQAIQASMKKNMKPMMIAGLTTCIGFLAINTSDVPPFRYLANTATIGIFVSVTLCLTYLPLMFSLLPVRIKSNEQTYSNRTKMASTILNNHKLVIGLIITVFIILASGLSNNQLNERFLKQFSERTEFRNDSDFYSENISGPYWFEISIKTASKEAGSIFDADFMAKMNDFTSWLESHEQNRHTLSIVENIKTINENMTGEYKLPETRELMAQYFLVYELSLPYGLDPYNLVSMNKDSIRIVFRFNDIDSRDILLLEDEVKNWLDTNLEQETYTIGSTTLMFTHITKRSVDSVMVGTVIGALLISIILMVALGSFKAGLLSLIPNIMPVVLALGAWGFIDGNIGMTMSIVLTIVLGIIVDDTVHFVCGYHSERKRGIEQHEAIFNTFVTLIKPLTYTTIILMVGFLLLSTSDFSRNGDLGMMASISLAIALIFDLVLLPSLLMISSTKNNNDKAV